MTNIIIENEKVSSYFIKINKYKDEGGGEVYKETENEHDVDTFTTSRINVFGV